MQAEGEALRYLARQQQAQVRALAFGALQP